MFRTKGWLMLLVFCITIVYCRAQELGWAYVKSYESVYFIDVEADTSNQSCFVYGVVTESVTLGGTIIPYSSNSTQFVGKLDINGNFLWARPINSNEPFSERSHIAVDSNSNVYLVNRFRNNASNPLIIGSYSLSSNGYSDIFIAKFSAIGDCLWVIQAGGIFDEWVDSITIDSVSNLIICGMYGDYETEANTSFGSYSLQSNGGYDGYIAKLDQNGNWIWALNAGGIGNDRAINVTTDTYNNIYVSGSYENSSTFGNQELLSSGMKDIFVGKLNQEGMWQWVSHAGGPMDDYAINIVLGANNEIIISGEVWAINGYDVLFGNLNIMGYSGEMMFIARLDCLGNWIWVSSLGGGVVIDMAKDTNNDLYFTGRFSGTAVFGDHNVICYGDSLDTMDMFVAKLDSNNEWSWVEHIYSDGWDVGASIGIDSFHNVYIVGLTWNYTSGLNVGQYFLDNVNGESNFIGKLSLPDNMAYLDSIYNQGIDVGQVFIQEISEPHPITIGNTGIMNLELISIALASQNSCFSYELLNGSSTIVPNSQGIINIRFTPQTTGICVDTLIIVNNSTNLPLLKIRLSGSGLDVPPNPPENVVMVMNGIDAVLSWDAVTENSHGQPMTPDYYFVYFNGSDNPLGLFYFLGRAFGTSYTHFDVGLGAEHMFYRVKAIKLYREGQSDAEKADKEAWLSTALKQGMSEAEVLKVLQGY